MTARDGLDEAAPSEAPLTRRALRAGTGATPVVDGTRATDADTTRSTDADTATPSPATTPAATTPAATGGSAPKARIPALTWVDPAVVAARTTHGALLDGTGTAAEPAAPDLLAKRPHRSPWRAGVLVPVVLLALILGTYTAGTQLWPLHAIPPQLTLQTVESATAPAATPAWPETGVAAISVEGIGGPIASSAEVLPMASVTKVVTALLVLEAMPLAPGEQGPEYRFTGNDNRLYWQYRANDESALDVPVGGVLTQYQLLEGVLIGSANNYADRLAQSIWPSDEVFARAANDWLELRGLSGVHVADPTGIEPENTADPASLIPLARIALAHPVIAEIVAKPGTEIPGAGWVPNTNGLLADPGVIGVKTGSLGPIWNLLSAKDITVGDQVVRAYASVIAQPNDETRVAASRALYAELEQSLQPTTAVDRGTPVGTVSTVWGEDVAVVTKADAPLILWNGATGAVSTTPALGDAAEKGADVGTLTVRGPLDSATVALVLDDDVDPPSPLWRLTHPLELLGIN